MECACLLIMDEWRKFFHGQDALDTQDEFLFLASLNGLQHAPACGMGGTCDLKLTNVLL
jgi:hypothetical protein